MTEPLKSSLLQTNNILTNNILKKDPNKKRSPERLRFFWHASLREIELK